MLRRILCLIVLGLLLAAPAARASNGRPPPGAAIMQIVIPRLDLNMHVVEGNPPSNEDGDYPTHYRTTDWPGEDGTVAISAHHFTHALPGAAGGPFLRLNELRVGDIIILRPRSRYGGGTYRYRVTGQREFSCGRDPISCPAALRGFTKLQQNKLILTTCIGNGDERRFVYAFATNRP